MSKCRPRSRGHNLLTHSLTYAIQRDINKPNLRPWYYCEWKWIHFACTGAHLRTLCPDKEWLSFQEEDLRLVLWLNQVLINFSLLKCRKNYQDLLQFWTVLIHLWVQFKNHKHSKKHKKIMYNLLSEPLWIQDNNISDMFLWWWSIWDYYSVAGWLRTRRMLPLATPARETRMDSIVKTWNLSLMSSTGPSRLSKWPGDAICHCRSCPTLVDSR